MLDAGIDVISTVNVQHLESLNDTVFELTGVRVRETLPDRILDEADEVVLVDLSPEELQDRIQRAGKVYPLGRVETALANFFRADKLSSLRQLALRELSEDVEARRESRVRSTRPPSRPSSSGSWCWSRRSPARSGCCAGPGARLSGWAPTSTSLWVRKRGRAACRRPDRGAGRAAAAGGDPGCALPRGGVERRDRVGARGRDRSRHDLRVLEHARAPAAGGGRCTARSSAG